MDGISTILLAALVGGLVASSVRVPPLVGFLAAGFVLSAAGVQAEPTLEFVGDLGVTVLLFGVGLKVDVRTLLRREVWGTAAAHMLVTTTVIAGAIGALGALGVGLAGTAPRTWFLVGFALSFSSTVVVVKLLEVRGTNRSFGGRTAIGILVVQDVAAVAFLASAEGRPPSPWAVLLVLVIPGAVVLRRVLSVVGHGELLALFGVVAALVPGYALFEALGVKGDLGALVIGMLLARHPVADELSKSIFALKDLLLVAFFVSIGLGGLPTPTELGVALALLLLLPLKALGFSVLLWLARLRRRTAILTGTTLGNYSEFGLIVVALAPVGMLDPEWVRVIATTVAASFVVAALPGRFPEYLSEALRGVLPDRSVERTHPEDRPLDLTGADAVVLGMGRVGRAAYERLRHGYGLEVVGVETSRDRCERLAAHGLRVVEADATDPELWSSRPFCDVSLVVLSMPFHGNNLDALDELRTNGYEGAVAVVAQHDDDLATALERGAHAGFQLYDGAGVELADRAAAVIGRRLPKGKPDSGPLRAPQDEPPE
ncbi:cation:proton antiporter [uncultured Phycicoccus sp.]|uniref:cation:proton antiporter domain-containing protein n=1 Tax=uncultured Phycicoccus sp. TaxID=661422 RepID=UPI00262D9622|nr:cation:proton antiporter [uncultured Phycicoccus sp.]